jgi:hypothetical protein
MSTVLIIVGVVIVNSVLGAFVVAVLCKWQFINPINRLPEGSWTQDILIALMCVFWELVVVIDLVYVVLAVVIIVLSVLTELLDSKIRIGSSK